MTRHSINAAASRKPARALDAAGMSFPRGCGLVIESSDQRLPSRLEPPM